MSFFMWLFVEKKLAETYTGTLCRYKLLSEDEKFHLYQEYSRWEET